LAGRMLGDASGGRGDGGGGREDIGQGEGRGEDFWGDV